MRAITLAATALIVATFAPGCIGFDDDGGDETGNNTTDGNDSGTNGSANVNASANASGNGTNASANASADVGNGTGNETGNETGNGSGEWSEENRSGSMGGLGLVVEGTAIAEETFTVENGTAALELNLTVDGDEVEMTIVPAGCEDSSCEQSVTTEDGNASFRSDSPEAGEWTVQMAVQGVGPVSAEYMLVIRTLVGGNTTTSEASGTTTVLADGPELPQVTEPIVAGPAER